LLTGKDVDHSFYCEVIGGVRDSSDFKDLLSFGQVPVRAGPAARGGDAAPGQAGGSDMRIPFKIPPILPGPSQDSMSSEMWMWTFRDASTTRDLQTVPRLPVQGDHGLAGPRPPGHLRGPIEGPVHSHEIVSERDLEAEDRLFDSGWDVVRFPHDGDWSAIAAQFTRYSEQRHEEGSFRVPRQSSRYGLLGRTDGLVSVSSYSK
jgi:hypothetical protein